MDQLEKNNARVLLVANEEETCSILSGFLQKEGLHVETAHNMTQAKSVFTKKGADLVFTDLEIPEAKSMEFLKELKELNPHVRVVTLTGHASIDSYLKAMALGAFEYLQKPIQIDTLHDVIKKALDR